MSAEWKQPCWNVIAQPGGLSTCVLTWCCRCVTYGVNVSKLGDAKAEVMCSGEFAPACCLYCCVASLGCPCIIHISTRKYIRTKYGLKEPQLGVFEDLFMTCCCSCCAIIQDYNEISLGQGVGKGAIFTNLQAATETTTADVKQVEAAEDSKAEAVEKSTENAEGEVAKGKEADAA